MSTATANTFDLVPISDFCETGSGGTPSRSEASRYFGGSIPWVKSGELREGIITTTDETITDLGLRESAAKLLPKNTLLVALYGATVGRIGVLGIQAATNQAVCHIIPDGRRANRTFLFYALRAQVPYWLSQRVGVGQPNISQGVIRDTKIPLPSLSEQKRIADILDKADAIHRKRQEMSHDVESLIHSIFLTTVGPDAEGFSAWPVQTIAALAEQQDGSMRTGPFGSDLKHSEFIDDGIAVLGIDNAVKNRFTWAERRFISEKKYEGLRRYTVHPGDVIVTIMGTVGRSAVVPDDIPRAINTKHLACVTLDREKAEPEFLSQSIHRHPYLLKQLGVAGRGAIMTGLNLGIIKSLRIPVPPIAVQQRFTDVVAEIRQIETRLFAATKEADDLFNSLVQRAFRGEL